MKTEMGEYLVGAYLKLIECCDIVDYNVRPPIEGIKGLGELDVIGLRFSDGTAFICEVTTHLGGLLYGKRADTIKKLVEKNRRQITYADQFLKSFPHKKYQLWSPKVGGKTLAGLNIVGLELIINNEYAKRLSDLRFRASKTEKDYGNPFFRVLQIIEQSKLSK